MSVTSSIEMSWIAAAHVGNESPTEKAFWTHQQNVACETQSVHDDSSYQVKERMGSSRCESSSVMWDRQRLLNLLIFFWTRLTRDHASHTRVWSLSTQPEQHRRPALFLYYSLSSFSAFSFLCLSLLTVFSLEKRAVDLSLVIYDRTSTSLVPKWPCSVHAAIKTYLTKI